MRSGEYIEIATVSANAVSWLDTPISPGTYYWYRVRSWNAFGNSPYSNEAWSAISGNWGQIRAGWYHTVSLKSAGTLWTWGYNNYGQLGLADTMIDRNIPTPVIFGLPDAPTDLATTLISSSQIDLNWTDNAGNESGFRIERKTGRYGTYEEIVPTQGVGIGPDVTTWTDISQNGFVPGSYYYYRIRAFNDFGNSSYYEVYTALS